MVPNRQLTWERLGEKPIEPEESLCFCLGIFLGENLIGLPSPDRDDFRDVLGGVGHQKTIYSPSR